MNYQQPDSAPLGLDDATSGRRGRRSSGQRIIMFFCLVAVVVVVFTLMAINAEDISQKQKEESKRETRTTGFADSRLLEDELFAAASRGGYAPPAITVSPDPIIAQQKTQIILVRPASPVKTPVKKRARPLSDAERELAKKYRDMKNSAILSKTNVEGFTADLREPPAEGRQANDSSFILPNHAPQYDLPPEAMSMLQEIRKDPNGQSEKLDFLLKDGGGRTPQGYSDNTRMPQVARLELKAGTVIPGLLITGLNSDLPGAVLGQVSANVYDSATGNYVLIPQGSRIMGAYDSKVSHGQKRIGIVWNRIIYPDGSSLNISGSPGTDLAGYSGIKGRVDNHYGQLLSAAFFSSVFAGAADIATGGRNNSNSGNESKSIRDVIVETAGAEIAAIGAKMADRALDIQPTIKIKPGQRFNVMVQQDVVFLQSWTPGKSSAPGF